MKKNKYQKPDMVIVSMEQHCLDPQSEPDGGNSREYDNSSNNNIFSEEP